MRRSFCDTLRGVGITMIEIPGTGSDQTGGVQLMVFPSIFKGEHINHPKKVSVFTGHHIKVRFNEPSPLQIDGETVKNVLEYAVDLE